MFEEYSFVFDIDGTLCPIKKKDEKYEGLSTIQGNGGEIEILP